jgi:hypothetical protein
LVFRRLHEDLNGKCQDEKILNSKLYELERKNVVLATENKEVCRTNFSSSFKKKISCNLGATKI